ncbi:YesL family protein [Bifidobacterium magnum]|uniref:Beta-carotene 15,15'-monooxygenase n=1 Tax=Bifidobacterium magnum TaxID=1692 RepID=A0A087BAL4_9BIFI|nr:YesL family protein [Bifidobacterium magnum]KFI68064.1 hypothetical protein BMAGN_0011 [Bifidobacterium magnum]
MHFLDADSKFMNAWTNLTDAIWINILMTITSLPIFTIGASLAAGQTAIRKLMNSEGHLTKAYFRAFKENFVKATVIWIIFGLAGFVCLYSWVILQISGLLIPKIALTVVWFIGFEWVFALQARFENTIGKTISNAYIFGVTYFWGTLAMAGIDILVAFIVIASWFLLPQGLFLLAILGYGCVLTAHVPIQEYFFHKGGYLKKDSER